MAIWPPLLAVAGQGDASERHRHHSLHAVIAREGTIRTSVGDDSREAAGIITGPDVEHAIDARGGNVLLLFADPESVPGARLVAALGGEGWAVVEDEVRNELVAGLSATPRSPEVASWAEEAVATLSGDSWERPRMHPREQRLLRQLRELPPEADVSLEALAARIGLSPSRLMHVFTESVGIPLRPYLRWLRFQRAATAIVAGMTLSVAAAEAGFADVAHMTRTFKQMFGLAPSALQRRSGPSGRLR